MFGFGGIKEKDFKDTTLIKQTEGIAKAEIKLSRWFPKFKEAQVWLDDRINMDMMPYVPFKTGAMQTAINAKNNQLRGTGKICVYSMPYGRRVYNGINKNGGTMHYTNPLTTPHWFVTVKDNYKNQWIRGVKDIIGRK